ncbi:MAG: type II toxin-antitoxin system RelE/ParE family toxin [Planctomycetaceae bacterium]
MASVEFRPEAREELASAHRWYLERNRRTAERLNREVDEAIERVSFDPTSLPLYDDAHRFCKLRTLPYLIVFHVKQKVIEVLAVAHVRRRPGCWRDR